MFKRRYAMPVAVLISLLPASLWAQAIDLPQRQTPVPETTPGVPHIQLNVTPRPALSEALLERVGALPGVILGPTRVSLPGAVGFQLASDVDLARPDVIVGGREFAHLHPDGSLHASLDPSVAQAAVATGWATPHPWANQRAGWEGFVMIFTPQTPAELDVVTTLVESGYSFVTGQPVP